MHLYESYPIIFNEQYYLKNILLTFVQSLKFERHFLDSTKLSCTTFNDNEYSTVHLVPNIEKKFL